MGNLKTFNEYRRDYVTGMEDLMQQLQEALNSSYIKFDMDLDTEFGMATVKEGSSTAIISFAGQEASINFQDTSGSINDDFKDEVSSAVEKCLNNLNIDYDGPKDIEDNTKFFVRGVNFDEYYK